MSLFGTLKELAKSCRINIPEFGSLATSRPSSWFTQPGLESRRWVSARSKGEREEVKRSGFFPIPVLESRENVWEVNRSFYHARPLRTDRLPVSSELLFDSLCSTPRSSRRRNSWCPSISHTAIVPGREHATVWKDFR